MTTIDADIHVIECSNKHGYYFAERDVTRCLIKNTVHDIATGQVENVSAVYAFNPAERWSQDVSEDVAGQVVDFLRDTYNSIADCPNLDFLQSHIGAQRLERIMADLGEVCDG